uniref:Uncharacterized protein n=1 Tax=Rhizophagus irregularis (strain DAOM 181602 / DAOM 197198 / MUCL 43194) TaxID=747089 RepID=U9TGI6_RHIID
MKEKQKELKKGTRNNDVKINKAQIKINESKSKRKEKSNQKKEVMTKMIRTRNENQKETKET